MTVWAIILAAGENERFDGIKALAEWDNGTLLSKAIVTAHVIFGHNIVIVTGGHTDAITNAAKGISTVYNANWRSGHGTSIAAGIRHVSDQHATMAIVLPVDQPFITAGHLNKLIEKANTSQSCALSGDRDVIGPPAAIPAVFFNNLSQLQGDKGLKSVLDRYEVVECPGVLNDIDTQDDLQRLKANLKTV